jgi:hypothetical protein
MKLFKYMGAVDPTGTVVFAVLGCEEHNFKFAIKKYLLDLETVGRQNLTMEYMTNEARMLLNDKCPGCVDRIAKERMGEAGTWQLEQNYDGGNNG